MLFAVSDLALSFFAFLLMAGFAVEYVFKKAVASPTAQQGAAKVLFKLFKK
jgi:hypothetical protein